MVYAVALLRVRSLNLKVGNVSNAGILVMNCESPGGSGRDVPEMDAAWEFLQAVSKAFAVV